MPIRGERHQLTNGFTGGAGAPFAPFDRLQPRHRRSDAGHADLTPSCAARRRSRPPMQRGPLRSKAGGVLHPHKLGRCLRACRQDGLVEGRTVGSSASASRLGKSHLTRAGPRRRPNRPRLSPACRASIASITVFRAWASVDLPENGVVDAKILVTDTVADTLDLRPRLGREFQSSGMRRTASEMVWIA